MRIEAGAKQDQLGLDLVGRLFEGAAKTIEIILPRRAETDRFIQRVAEALALTSLVSGAGAGVETVAVAVNAEKHHRGVFVKNVLRAIAVVDVPVHDEDGRE